MILQHILRQVYLTNKRSYIYVANISVEIRNSASGSISPQHVHMHSQNTPTRTHSDRCNSICIDSLLLRETRGSLFTELFTMSMLNQMFSELLQSAHSRPTKILNNMCWGYFTRANKNFCLNINL